MMFLRMRVRCEVKPSSLMKGLAALISPCGPMTGANQVGIG